MTNSHTPGPWKALVWHRSIQIHKENENPKDDLAIAVLRADSEHAASDALLIAAAPDLLNAALLLLSLAGPVDDEDELVRIHYSAARQKLMNIINKARGERA